MYETKTLVELVRTFKNIVGTSLALDTALTIQIFVNLLTKITVEDMQLYSRQSCITEVTKRQHTDPKERRQSTRQSRQRTPTPPPSYRHARSS